MLSTRVVVDPQRTPLHLPWARHCRDVLPEGLHDELRRLVSPFGSYVPGVFEIGLGTSSRGFADDLAAFQAIDDDLIAYELSLSISQIGCAIEEGRGPERIHEADHRDEMVAAVAHDDHRSTLLRMALDDPGRLRTEYADLLSGYWDAAFAAEWDRIVPSIEAEVTDGAHALVTRGAPGLTAEMLPEGRWDPDQSAIVIAKDWDGVCDVAERGGLLFVPTVYGWPCVLIEMSEPWPLSIIYPLHELRSPPVPTASDIEVVDGFRALSDETRLQIARLVAGASRSTKELAQLLSLSDSAISRHLKIMESAGLVTSHRDGYFVLYDLRPDRIDVLAGALRATLGLDQTSSGAVAALPVSIGRLTAG